MTRILYGAITVGRRTDVDACSSVEARTVDGARIVVLAAVQGELATPALEVVKGNFAKLALADAAAAAKLAAAGLPPPFATGIAIVLLAGERAFVAASGAARCYRDRGGVLTPLDAGAVDLAAGDTLIAASHAELVVGRAFLGADVPAAVDDDTFRNNLLDDALDAALAGHAGLLSAAAARVL